MSDTRAKVRVSLAERSYDILIGDGLVAGAGELIKPLLKPGRKRVFIVADETVDKLHGDKLLLALAVAGLSISKSIVPSGETSKSFSQLDTVLSDLIEAGAERDDLILAFGGGVVGDLTGLAAGLLKRGARFLQIPTTLLSQVDSSVGGKTAINSRAGKNMVGLFYQPVLVLADLDVLSTLPEREMAAGLAEVAKYALIDNPQFFDFLERNAADLRAGKKEALAEAVRVSCESKARIVAIDELEQAERALLNLGHTFGHALERANNFGPALLHGEGVGAGMAMAMRYSVDIGECSGQDAKRAESLLNALGLATRIADLKGGPYKPDELLAHMAHDKKARNGRLTLILSRGIGKAYIQRDVDTGPILKFLEKEAAAAS
ncbi:MAG TPA: 3-dehydroquinate synthase [Hyphomonadaceae bacterium]|jgi:3-dehydroquinate synthase|nr:3-dehydroquinate synthase [Hyphomonadaceae bacterium]